MWLTHGVGHKWESAVCVIEPSANPGSENPEKKLCEYSLEELSCWTHVFKVVVAH